MKTQGLKIQNVWEQASRHFPILFSLLCMSLLFQGCKKDQVKDDEARMTVLLHGSGLSFLRVDMNIIAMEISYKGEGNISNTWRGLPNYGETRVFDIMRLQNNSRIINVAHGLKLGRIDRVALVFGDSNSVMLPDGTVRPLAFRGPMTKAVVVPVVTDIAGGKELILTLTVDADKSVISEGDDGQYYLEPAVSMKTVIYREHD
jgi:hypothetical protein